MRRSAAHKFLDKQISALENLKQHHLGSSEVSAWFRETRLILQRIFGPTTKHCGTLDSIIVAPGIYTVGGGYDPVRDHAQFVEDLDEAARFLRLLKDEVTRDSTFLGLYRPSVRGSQEITTDNITLAWLVRHVPMSFWFIAAGALTATFVAGVRAGQIEWIRDWFTKP